MSIKPPARCILCARVMGADGFRITLRSPDKRRALTWCEGCAPEDELHEHVADAEALCSRAATPEQRADAEEAMVQAYHRIVRVLDDRHGARLADLIYRGIRR